MSKTHFVSTCGMTTYQKIQITLDNFEIIFIEALFGSGTAVSSDRSDQTTRALSDSEIQLFTQNSEFWDKHLKFTQKY